MDEESAAAQENPPKTRRQQAPGISGCSWHTLAVEEVVESLQTDAKAGLSAGEADRRLTRYGPNTLVEAKGRSALSIFAAQFNSLIVGLLVAAGVVALVLGDQVEAAAILVVILFNAAVGYATEWRAERDLDGLRKQTVATAQVVRGGLARRIPAADLVPGDLVVLNSGDRVPADGRLVEGTRLRIEEAAMTGESVPVAKIFAPIPDANAPLGDRLNCVFLGTAVTDGRGRLLVTATGARTELGRIGTMLEEAGDRETPLERQLARLGRHLIFLVLILCGVIVAAGWAQGHDLLYMLEVGISLAIAAVPEGLTAVTTMTLAIGVQRMARMGALVRRLPAVETLGSTTVICTDKTGTLTRNEMTMQALRLGDRSIEFTGVGYGVEGNACENGQYVDPADDAHLALALRIGALCSDAKLDEGSDEPTVLGDPTEVALLIAARKGGLTKEALEREYPRVGEAPFSSASMRMTTVHRTPEGRLVAFVKGAPGALAKASSAMLIDGATKPMTSQDRERVLKANRELAGRAFRVLALACKDVPAGYADHDLTDGLTFVGLVAMIDPLREEAGPAIDKCRRAGIRTVMITGDQEATAAEIGRQLGLDRDPKGRPLRTAHGRELAGLDEAGRRALAAEVGAFARVSPEDKLRLVEALQAGGEAVAMTGDGVNDAPALKQADIGVAMGVKGTEIAKDASAMVVTDDDFATIVGAIEQGRIVYANIQRFVLYLFSCNLAEILVVFVAILIGWPLPLLALQVLWLNIVTDVFPALALALEPSNRGVMESPPRDPKESMISPPIMRLVAWQGAMLSAVTLIAFAVGLHWYGDEGEGLSQAVTIAFMTLALTQTFHTFNCRSKSRSAFTDRVFTNRWLWGAVGACVFLQSAALYVPLLQRVLHTTPVSAADWLLILACSVAPVALVEFVKFVKRAC